MHLYFIYIFRSKPLQSSFHFVQFSAVSCIFRDKIRVFYFSFTLSKMKYVLQLNRIRDMEKDLFLIGSSGVYVCVCMCVGMSLYVYLCYAPQMIWYYYFVFEYKSNARTSRITLLVAGSTRATTWNIKLHLWCSTIENTSQAHIHSNENDICHFESSSNGISERGVVVNERERAKKSRKYSEKRDAHKSIIRLLWRPPVNSYERQATCGSRKQFHSSSTSCECDGATIRLSSNMQ